MSLGLKHCGHSHCSGVFTALDKGGEHTTEDDGEHTTEDDGETDSCIGASPVIAGFRSRDEKEPKFKASLGCKVT